MKTKFLAASALLLMTSGASIGKAVSVNVSKLEAGEGGQGSLGGSISAVPLPAAGWMLLAGLGGIAVMRRRSNA
mgnify:CR=1 FL=1